MNRQKKEGRGWSFLPLIALPVCCILPLFLSAVPAGVSGVLAFVLDGPGRYVVVGIGVVTAGVLLRHLLKKKAEKLTDRNGNRHGNSE